MTQSYYLQLMEKENEALKRENEYLRRLLDRDLEYSVLKPPDNMPMPLTRDTIILSRIGGVQAISEFDGWHIRGAMDIPGKIQFSYFVSHRNLVTKHGAIAELEHCLKAVIEGVYKQTTGEA